MAVVGVMGVIFVINYPASQQRARDAVRRNDIKQYQAALEIFASRNNQLYPAVDGNLVNMCAALLGAGSVCSDDPRWPGVGRYQYVAEGSGTGYVISAELEYEPSGTTQFFNVFSTGVSCTNNSRGTCEEDFETLPDPI
jgi:type II secretory pathway pseudopilin PulG